MSEYCIMDKEDFVGFGACLTVKNFLAGRSKLMAAKGNNEVQDSVREMARIYRPANPRKFVKEYVKKYRIPGGYEDILTRIVEVELSKLDGSVS